MAEIKRRQFSDININEGFTIAGEKMVKLTALTFKSLEQPSLGEQYNNPMVESQIDRDDPKADKPIVDCSASVINEDGQKVEPLSKARVRKQKSFPKIEAVKKRKIKASRKHKSDR